MRSLWTRPSPNSVNTGYLSVLDLGVSSVKALVLQRVGDQVTILGRGRALAQGVGPGPDGLAPDGAITDLDALASICERALCEAEDMTAETCGHKVVPDEALIAVPASCSRGALGQGRARRIAVETGIGAEEWTTSVAHAGRRALRELGRLTGVGKWEVIDGAVVAFTVDGHRVTDPIGFRGHLLEATVFAAAAPQGLAASLRQLADRLQLDPPGLVAEPVSLAAACPDDGLVIEVGARTTGLCLARYGAPLAFSSVPWGGDNLTQALADTFQLFPSRAEALKRAYGAGQLSPEGTSAVQKALAVPIQSWISAVLEQLEPWRERIRVWPPEIYVCGGTGALPGLAESVSAVRWLDQLPFPRTPNVSIWDGSPLARVVDRTEPRWLVGDVVVLSVAALAAHDRNASTPDGVLRTVLGIG
jgi:cell division protein FtsA